MKGKINILMKQVMKVAALSVAVATLGVACNKGGKMLTDYTKSDEGLLYKVVTENKSGAAVTAGDVVFGTIYECYVSGDSTTILNGSNGEVVPLTQAHTPQNAFDFMGGLIFLHVGDSAMFAIPADSLASQIGADRMPPMYTAGKGDYLRYDIRVAKTLSEGDYRAQMEQENAQRKEASEAALAQYIRDNKITAKPDKDGLYRIVTRKGTGAVISNDKQVKIHYTGKFLNGDVFDSSLQRDPLSLTVGKKQVIQGWELGLLGLYEGSTATLIIPYNLAYGEQGAGPIPPYSTLVFDIEVVEVK